MGSNSSVVNTEGNDNKYYWQDLGLKHEPFVRNPSEVFKIAQWEDYSDLLIHLVQHNNLLEVILGENGVGKTSFINFFNQKIILKASCAVIRAEPEWRVEQFINVINTSLGFAQNEISSESLEMLNAHLPADGIKYIIALDDADYLSEEILLLLKQWTSRLDDNIRLRFILVANIDFRHKLKSFYSVDEYEQFLTVLELKSLDLKQTQSYIKYCLANAGLAEGYLFTQKDIKKIYRDSNGIFNKINEIARRMLIDKLVKNQDMYSIVQSNKKTFFFSAIILVVISIFLFSKSQDTNISTGIEDSNGQFVSFKESLADEEILSLELAELDDIEKQQSLSFTKDDISQNSVEVDLDDIFQNNVEVAEENKLATNNLTENTSELELTDELVKESLTDNTATKKELASVKNESTTNNNIIKGSIVNSTTYVREKIILTESVETIQERATIILQEPKTNYTIQLIAANTAVAAANFIAENKLENHANYYTNSRQSKLWYAVIYGSYKTKEDARLAVAKMPFKLRKNNPWIRKVSEVQTIIKLSSNTKKS